MNDDLLDADVEDLSGTDDMGDGADTGTEVGRPFDLEVDASLVAVPEVIEAYAAFPAGREFLDQHGDGAGEQIEHAQVGARHLLGRLPPESAQSLLEAAQGLSEEGEIALVTTLANYGRTVQGISTPGAAGRRTTMDNNQDEQQFHETTAEVKDLIEKEHAATAVGDIAGAERLRAQRRAAAVKANPQMED